jgi:hypothetical protein
MAPGHANPFLAKNSPSIDLFAKVNARILNVLNQTQSAGNRP